MVVRRGAISCAYCLRIREEISSGPVALDGSSLLSSFSMPFIICYDENSEKVQKEKKFWNYIRNTKKDSSGVAPLRQEGMLIDDTSPKAEI
jgi:hypothetical protein